MRLDGRRVIKKRNRTTNKMITVIIPAYNEEKTIGQVIEEVKNNLKTEEYEIIMVDDCSTDRTYEIAKSKKIKVIKQSRNLRGDYGGFSDALKMSKGNIIAKIDADLEHDPSNILDAVKRIREEKFDLIIGERPQYSRWIEYLINYKYRKYFKDFLSGFIVFNRNLANEAIKYHLKIWIELPLFAIKRGYNFGEIKIKYKKREGGPKFGGFFERNWEDYLHYHRSKKRVDRLLNNLKYQGELPK